MNSIDKKRYEEFLEKLKTDPEYKEKVIEIRKNNREKNEKLKEKRKKQLENNDFGPDYAENNTTEYTGGRYRDPFPKKPAPEITDSTIEKIVERLKSESIIDDEKFAKYFVENRNLIKGTSVKKLKLELRKKGIADKIIETVLSADENGNTIRNDAEEIQKIIAKKRKKYDDDKLIQYLCRQGFDYQLVQNLVRSYETDSQSSE